MAKGALFIRWGFPAPALAEKAVKAFGEATEYWKRKQEERMIDGAVRAVGNKSHRTGKNACQRSV